MASMSNFTVYLDECLDRDQLIALLRREGWTVISPRDVGSLKWKDEEHLEFCAQHGYPLLTRDADDFSALHHQWQAQGKQHAGILAVYAERDASKHMSDYDIVRAIKNILTLGIPIANQFVVLNHWR